MAEEVPDPEAIGSRVDFSDALSTLRERAGVTIRLVSEQSGVSPGTLSGWFGGQHVPEKASESVFAEVLRVCGVQDQGVVDSWMAALRRVRGQRRERATGTDPYRGLEPYRIDDSDWFFGRGTLISRIVDRVRAARTDASTGRVIVVTGPSGSGKSSILNAGIGPAMEALGLNVLRITPQDTRGVSTLSRTEVDVLVVDQFEDMWTECADGANCRRILSEINGAADGPVVVIGLRADYIDRARREPVLRSALDDPIAVGRLVGEDVRSVIVEPARRAGWTVDPDLVQLLLIEFSTSGSRAALDDGALALLSHALLETWRHSTRHRMTVADYVATGGISGAVHRSAESVYAELTSTQRRLARRLFLRLIVIDESAVLRRRAAHVEIFADDVADVRIVVEKFARSRLLTVERDYVEITHETLISAWTRLGTWVDNDRDGIIAHRRLALAALRWRESGDTAALPGPSELAHMQQWQPGGEREAELNHFEREYLAAGRAQRDSRADHERRRRRHTRRLVAALALLTILAVALTATVVHLRLGILQERRLAEQARDEATARSLAAEANDLRDSDPALGAQIALAAYRLAPTVETRSALLDATSAGTPVRWIGPAGGTRTAIAPSGGLAALGFEDGTVELMRIDDRPAIAPLAEMSIVGAVSSLAFDPSGNLLAVAAGGRIELWDLDDPGSPTEQGRLTSGGPAITSFVFAPDGLQVVASTTSNALLRWDISDPKRPRRLGAGRSVESGAVVAYSPDGRLLVAGSRDTSLRVWNADDPTGPADVDLHTGGNRIVALRFSPDGRTVAAAIQGREIRRWEVIGTGLRPLPGFIAGGEVGAIDFSPDGRSLVGAGTDGVTIWDLASGRTTVLPDPVAARSVAVDRSGAVLVGDRDGVVRLWPMRALPDSDEPREGAGHAAADASGRSLLRPDEPRVPVGLWDLSAALGPIERIAQLPLPADDPLAGDVALSPDGSLAAVASGSGRVHLWDLTDPAHPVSMGTPIAAVGSVVDSLAFDATGSMLAIASRDPAEIALWDVSTPDRPRSIDGPGRIGRPVGTLAFDRRGEVLAAASTDGRIRLWHVTESGVVGEYPAIDSATGPIAFSPIDDLLVAVGTDRMLRVLDVEHPRFPGLVDVLDGPVDETAALTFTQDGGRIVAGTGSGVWLWAVRSDHDEVPTGAGSWSEVAFDRFAVLGTRYGRFTTVVGSGADGVVSGIDPTGVIRSWDADPDRAIAQLCASGSAPPTAEEWRRYPSGQSPRDPCEGVG